jgi:hypothetical protein
MNRIILCFLLLIAVGCKQNTKQQPVSEKIKTGKNADFLTGQTVKHIDSILSVEFNNSHIVYIFNQYDCGNCVHAGFLLLKELNALYGHEQVHAIICSPNNPSSLQEHYNYREYIYSDNNNVIRKALKYLPTPVFLLLNSENKILSIFFTDNTVPEHRQLFMKDCATHMK